MRNEVSGSSFLDYWDSRGPITAILSSDGKARYDTKRHIARHGQTY
jgi:hypothetical protein